MIHSPLALADGNNHQQETGGGQSFDAQAQPGIMARDCDWQVKRPEKDWPCVLSDPRRKFPTLVATISVD